LWVEPRPHECDFDPNSKSPLASCRLKYPPTPNHESYDLDRPLAQKTGDDREHTGSRLIN